MESSVPQTSGRPDPRTTRERLDSQQQEIAALRDEVAELRTWVRMLGHHLGYDPAALGFPQDETP